MTAFNRMFWLVLSGLLLLDLLLIGLHLAHGPEVPDRFDIISETSLASRLLYLKWAVVTAICAAIAWIWRVPVFAGLAVFFGVVLADDMMLIHEKGGRRLISALPDLPTFGLPRADVGEIYVFGLLGLVAGAAVLVGILRSNRDWVARAALFGLPFAGLVVCAIGVDALGAYLRLHHPEAATLSFIGILEDAGEIIFGSLAVAIAAGTWASLPVTRTRGAMLSPAE